MLTTELTQIKQQQKELSKLIDGNLTISDLQEQYLNKIIKILDFVDWIWISKWNPWEKENADYKLKLLKWYSSLNKKWEINDVDDLIDLCLKKIEWILSCSCTANDN